MIDDNDDNDDDKNDIGSAIEIDLLLTVNMSYYFHHRELSMSIRIEKLCIK